MADILFYFLIILGLYLAFLSYWLVAEALAPEFVERCRTRYALHPVRSSLLGVITVAPLLILVITLVKRMGNPVLQILGFAILLLIILAGLIGSTGLCRQIGRGLGRPGDEAQPWRRVLRGGVVLGLTFILPVLGWFAILPWTLISGVGVFVGACRKSKAESAALAPPIITAPET